MKNTWFTSDLHFCHHKMALGRGFKDCYEMEERLIHEWNCRVRGGDNVYVLGDFGFYSKRLATLRHALKGKVHLVVGNHDKKNKIQKSGWFTTVNDLITINIDRHPIILCHYEMRVWDRSHYGTWHLYGHCMDLKTEILTSRGWLFRKDLLSSDKVLTMNVNNDKFEYNNINEIIDYEHYKGDVYSLKSKGIDIRVTSEHNMLDKKIGSKGYRLFKANELKNIQKRVFVKAGILIQGGLPLSNNEIRLMVWIAADGSLANSSLSRIRVTKQSKINRIKGLLDEMGLKYSENKQKDNSVCFNFTVPNTLLKNYTLKPLSNKITRCNKEQFEILLEEYMHTDGYKNGASCIIYSSKKEEADNIQIAAIQNGYSCNISSRIGQGFSKKPNYEITVTKKQTRAHTDLKNKVKKTLVNDEHFWCVSVPNKTIVVRRNGKPIVVGNSHTGLNTPVCHNTGRGKTLDVGVDNFNMAPVEYEEIKEIMGKLPDNFNLIRRENGQINKNQSE